MIAAAMAAAVIVLLLGVRWRPVLLAPRGRSGQRVRSARRRRHAPPTAEAWAALLDGIGAEIRSGASLAAACRRTTARAGLHGAVVHPGCSPPFALEVAGTVGEQGAATPADEAVVVQALSAAHALGGPMAATLHAGAALLRERSAIRAEAATHSAQARLSARVLTAVPLVFAGWSLLSSRSFRVAMLSPPGLASATLGGLCNLLGWWWMRRIVGRVAA